MVITDNIAFKLQNQTISDVDLKVEIQFQLDCFDY